jgi:hypothetical protein
MNLEKKAIALRNHLKGDKNIFSIGIAEKNEYNPEDYLCIYTKYPFKPGTYPDTFDDVRVVTMHIGRVEIRGGV